MDLQPKLNLLAAALREQRAQILTDWLGTLRIGFEKPGVAMTDEQLRNHFAELLEDLCQQLEVPLTEASEITALRHAENHGDMRWMNGYKLPELIREIAALRTTVIAAVVDHGHPRLSLREQSLANIIVHRFFDALVVESATFFATLAQDAALLQERERLAQELHDSACQAFQSAVLQLAVIERQVEPQAAEQLRGISSSLRRGLEDLRAIAHGLAAVVRKFEQGLPSALQQLGAEISPLVPCHVRCEPGLDVPAKAGFQLLRMAQEAAANACKHAHPHALTITLARRHGAFELQIRDDGQGFDPAQPKGSGIGLRNMQQRARAIGAELQVESRPGAGTVVTCILPETSADSAHGE